MMRGTFANIRIKNEMVPGVEGGFTKLLPAGEQLSIYDAAMRYQAVGVPLIVVAGKDLARLPRLLETARRARRVMRQNLGWAIAYNAVALPLAALGFVPPWLASLGMAGSSLFVTLNALRLARAPAPPARAVTAIPRCLVGDAG
jgi:hypothetical protein